MPHKDEYTYKANYTEEIRKVHGETYRGYKLIGRDMDVRGGIFHAKNSPVEAVVVDPDKNPDIYWDYFNEACIRARELSGSFEIPPTSIPRAVFDTVRSKMEYSSVGVSDIRRQYGSTPGQRIELGTFMKNGVGECRHQALACAVLLEDFRDIGGIGGSISLDKSMRWNPKNQKDKSGHAWVRYTDSDGTKYILDVANNYFDTLEASTGDASWNYLRPEEELERYVLLQRKLGQAGVRGLMNRMRWLLRGK